VAASQHRSTRLTAIAPLGAALLLALAACGSTTPPDTPRTTALAPASSNGTVAERALTLNTRRGDVVARVRADAQLPGQFVAAFTPGLRDDLSESAPALARVVASVAGAEPAPRLTFYATDRSRFYLGDGAERFCVQVIRETEQGGIVSMRFAPAAESKAPPARLARAANAG
jgi:hypothetical protein